MRIERREHARYQAQENAFAALGRQYSKIGKIKDISIGGLAVEYIAGEDQADAVDQIDIFLTINAFHIYSLPCEVVYDTKVYIPHVNSRYVKLLTTRRCAVKFDPADADEYDQLMLFLEDYTIKSI